MRGDSAIVALINFVELTYKRFRYYEDRFNWPPEVILRW